MKVFTDKGWGEFCLSRYGSVFQYYFSCFPVGRNGVFVSQNFLSPADMYFAVGWSGFVLFFKLFLMRVS